MGLQQQRTEARGSISSLCGQRACSAPTRQFALISRDQTHRNIKMADADALVSALSSLSIAPAVVAHAPVENIADWAGALSAADGAAGAAATKTMLAKPKAGPAVLVVALGSSEFSVSAVGKAIGAKEPRMAAEDFITSTLGVGKNEGWSTWRLGLGLSI